MKKYTVFFLLLFFFVAKKIALVDTGFILEMSDANITLSPNQVDSGFGVNAILKLKATNEVIKAQQGITYQWLVADQNVVTGASQDFHDNPSSQACAFGIESPCPNYNAQLKGKNPGKTVITVAAIRGGSVLATAKVNVVVTGSGTSKTVAPGILCDNGLRTYTWEGGACEPGKKDGLIAICNNGVRVKTDFPSNCNVDTLGSVAEAACKRGACPPVKVISTALATPKPTSKPTPTPTPSPTVVPTPISSASPAVGHSNGGTSLSALWENILKWFQRALSSLKK